MKTKIESINPDRAKEYLERNFGNRPMSASLVTFLARQMPHSWRLTHQGIAFDTENNLIDGQHRLQAVVQSGATVQMVVVREVARECMLVVDTHKRRTDADALKIAGYNLTPRAIAVLKQLLRGAMSRSIRLTRDELRREYENYEDPVNFACMHLPHGGVVGMAPIAGVVARATFHVSTSTLRAFCQILSSNLPDNKHDASAPLVLYKYAAEHGRGHGGAGAHWRDLYLRTEAAIVAFVAGKTIRVLSPVTDEMFPLPDEEGKQKKAANG